MISNWAQTLRDCCILLKRILHVGMPMFDLYPEASFDFRGLLMPQKGYYSFKKGQLVSWLCDMNAMVLDWDDVLWTLEFASSTFAGKFSESFVQALYHCPLIKGLLFVKSENWQSIWSSDSEDEGQSTAGLLADLAGSLTPWVTCVSSTRMHWVALLSHHL